MEKLYIFIQDHGVYGMIVVVAKSKEEARLLMEGEPNYRSCKVIVQFDIEDGFSYANTGDM